MGISNLLGITNNSAINFNMASISKQISDLVSGATASFSSLGTDFAGLDVHGFHIIKDEIDAFINRCMEIKNKIKADDVAMLAITGASGYAAYQYVIAINTLIDAYLSSFKEFSSLSEDVLDNFQHGDTRNAEHIDEASADINNADLGLDPASSALTGGILAATGFANSADANATNAINENIVKESDVIAQELNEFENAEPTPEISETQPTVEEPVQVAETPVVETPQVSVSSNAASSPGTTDPYQATPYNFNPEEYKALCATVYAEAAEGNDYTYSDTMGVTSVMLNRLESGSYGGGIVDVLSAKGQFGGYGMQNKKFAAAMNDPSVISPEMMQAINDTLAGNRNTTGSSFSGNGTHNSFR